MDERASDVGAALAWLVSRMPAFLGISGEDVVMYRTVDRSGLPERLSGRDLIRTQASARERIKRNAYPAALRDVLNASLSSVMADDQLRAVAFDSFIAELSQKRSSVAAARGS